MNMKTITSTLGCLLALGMLSSAQAQPTFLATQASTLYRFQSPSAVSTFTLSTRVVGMTTVPAGMNVGNLNGGASGGDVLCFGIGGIFRLDDALGLAPTLTLIANANQGTASPVFVGTRLFGPASIAPGISTFVEINPTDFSQISEIPMGLPFGTGGMVATSATDFICSNQQTDMIYRYHMGDTFSTSIGPVPNADYGGMEEYGGTIYATFSLAPAGSGRFVFGSISPTDGSFTQLADLDTYYNTDGVTGLAILSSTSAPEPGTLGLLALGIMGGGVVVRSGGVVVRNRKGRTL